MTDPNTAATPLVFRGAPRRLLLQNAPPEIDQFEFEPDERLSPFLGSPQRSVRTKTNRAGKLQKFKLRLDPLTPPGQYHAVLKTSDGPLPIEINVETDSRAVILPSMLSLTGSPGDKIKLNLQFTNQGNTGFDIPKTASVGVYDNNGIESAFASTYRQDTENFEELATHFVKMLRDGHGGMVKLRILEGHGALAPAARSMVIIELQLPSKLKPGHHYHGRWRSSLFTLPIAIDVIK